MDIYFYWQWGSCVSETAQHTVGITKTDWIPTRMTPLLLISIPFLDSTARQFQNEKHTASFPSKKTWPSCLQAAHTCSPSHTFNCLIVQAADPSLSTVSWTGMCGAAEIHSVSLCPIREARAFSLFIISGFELGEVFWNNQFYKLLPRPA